MTLQFEYVRGDFVEASRAVQRLIWNGVGLRGCALWIGALIVGWLSGEMLSPRLAPPRPKTVIFSIAAVLLLSIWVPVMWFIRDKQRATIGGSKPQSPPLGALERIVTLLVCTTAGGAAFCMRYVAGSDPRDAARRAANSVELSTLVAVLGWVVILACLLVLSLNMIRRMQRQAWDRQPGLHRPKTITASAETLVVSDAVSESRYAWNAFTGWLETVNLFVLNLSHITFVMVPKRAFADVLQQNAFRDLLVARVAAGTSPTPPGAFPVRIVQPPPLPKNVTQAE